jgi:hypothetical protein
MSEKIVTYLIGAGASAQSIPVVNRFTSLIHDVIAQLNISADCMKTVGSNVRGLSTEEILQGISKLNNDLTWLVHSAQDLKSIDTFAKRLWLNDPRSNDLRRLKTCMIIIFVFYNYVTIKKDRTKSIDNYEFIDKRYDSFFTTLLNRNDDGIISLPDNLRLVSWNYDLEVERTVRTFFRDDNRSYENVSNFLNVNSKIEDPRQAQFAMRKINGSAIYSIATNYDSEIRDDAPLFDTRLDQVFIPMDWSHSDVRDLTEQEKTELRENISSFTLDIFRIYRSLTEFETNIDMKYAWEQDPFSSIIASDLRQIADGTQVLVVIGYSFPYFNRSIDQAFITQMHRLEKVVIQAPRSDISGIEDAVRALIEAAPWKFEGSPVLKDNCDQFHIPNELIV